MRASPRITARIVLNQAAPGAAGIGAGTRGAAFDTGGGGAWGSVAGGGVSTSTSGSSCSPVSTAAGAGRGRTPGAGAPGRGYVNSLEQPGSQRLRAGQPGVVRSRPAEEPDDDCQFWASGPTAPRMFETTPGTSLTP